MLVGSPRRVKRFLWKAKGFVGNFRGSGNSVVCRRGNRCAAFDETGGDMCRGAERYLVLFTPSRLEAVVLALVWDLGWFRPRPLRDLCRHGSNVLIAESVGGSGCRPGETSYQPVHVVLCLRVVQVPGLA